MAHSQTRQSSRRRVVTAASAQEQLLHNLLVQAKAAADKNDYATAAVDYEKYLAQKPDDAAAHFDLGYVYTAQAEKDKAIAEYRKAIALDPKMVQAYLNLGISLLGDDAKAAIAPLQKAAALNYGYAQGHYLLGTAEDRAGQSQNALKEYTIAVRLDPNDYASHMALARAELTAGNAGAAEREFREALKLKANDKEAELGLAQSLIGEKKAADAAAALDDYLRQNPDDVKARVTRASLLTQLGKDDEALAELDRASKSGTESLEALKLRATIYYGKMDFANAAAVLQKASAIAPQDADIRAKLGHALLENKDYAGAARELNEAFRLDSSTNDTLRDLVAAEYLSKNYPATLEALDLLDQREPPKPGAWFVRAMCYDHMGQSKAALDGYQKFLAMNTDQTSNEYFEATGRVRFLERVVKEKGH
ncbi:MAG TPA: tetratricopeptide repeat protein [Candidatus Dormibacteraeota bacterium]|nr:tetratricopeptide repeat protein [Candidatus Dormibacteraeota bacterium]